MWDAHKDWYMVFGTECIDSFVADTIAIYDYTKWYSEVLYYLHCEF
jgi:hypothetical protein